MGCTEFGDQRSYFRLWWLLRLVSAKKAKKADGFGVSSLDPPKNSITELTLIHNQEGSLASLLMKRT